MPAKMNLKKPYAEMCGEPGVAFLQNGDFFDKNGMFVKESGLPKKAEPIQLSVSETLARERLERHAEALRKASAILGPLGKPKNTQPLMEDVERENRRALVAEERGS